MERARREYLGSTPKYKIEISTEGFDMDADVWTVALTGGGHTRTYAKSDLIHKTDGWYIGFDTTEFGLGNYYAVITAQAPDTDFDGGFRTEVDQVLLCVVVDRPANTIW